MVGSLWVIGSDSRFEVTRVWRSADGVNWTRASGNGFGQNEKRDIPVVSHRGSLWAIGGDSFPQVTDVWRSSDGDNWVLVTISAAFPVREDHQAVSYGGSLWVIGGYGGYYGSSKRLNDVWRSADGANWVLVTISAAFPVRGERQAVSYGGSLWMFWRYRNDVWRSSDGETWVSVAVSSDVFSGRWGHQVVVKQEPLPFIHERTEIVVATPAVQVVSLDTMTAPLTLLTLSVSGGMGDLKFNQLDDSAGFCPRRSLSLGESRGGWGDCGYGVSAVGFHCDGVGRRFGCDAG